MLSELLLQSGSDIPFPEARISIHQPSIKEISYVTEENFYTGCSVLNFSKEKISVSDKTILERLTNFEIFMSMINNQKSLSKQDKNCVLMVLSLMFPDYQIKIDKQSFFLINQERNEITSINKENFEIFKSILRDMFCLNTSSGETTDYNPCGDRARMIAEKLRKGRAKKDSLKGENTKKINILSRYISILSVGLQKDKNILLKYTVPQLYDEFERFQLKLENDFYYQARLAGAKDLKEIDPWMKDLYAK
jgi:hypothetical protein